MQCTDSDGLEICKMKNRRKRRVLIYYNTKHQWRRREMERALCDCGNKDSLVRRLRVFGLFKDLCLIYSVKLSVLFLAVSSQRPNNLFN